MHSDTALFHNDYFFSSPILKKDSEKENVFASKYSLSIPPSSLFLGATPGEPTQRLGGGGLRATTPPTQTPGKSPCDHSLACRWLRRGIKLYVRRLMPHIRPGEE